MDVMEKLVELLNNSFAEQYEKRGLLTALRTATDLLAHGVTVQEWISVDDELPQYTGEYNVIVGVASEFGYFEKVTTLRFERIKGKEPRWVIPKNEIYNVISWMPLPQPPKGE